MELITKNNKKLNKLGRIKFLDHKTNTFVKIYKKVILKDDYKRPTRYFGHSFFVIL